MTLPFYSFFGGNIDYRRLLIRHEHDPAQPIHMSCLNPCVVVTKSHDHVPQFNWPASWPHLCIIPILAPIFIALHFFYKLWLGTLEHSLFRWFWIRMLLHPDFMFAGSIMLMRPSCPLRIQQLRRIIVWYVLYFTSDWPNCQTACVESAVESVLNHWRTTISDNYYLKNIKQWHWCQQRHWTNGVTDRQKFDIFRCVLMLGQNVFHMICSLCSMNKHT